MSRPSQTVRRGKYWPNYSTESRLTEWSQFTEAGQRDQSVKGKGVLKPSSIFRPISTNATENERGNAMCIEPIDTNVGQPCSITTLPSVHDLRSNENVGKLEVHWFNMPLGDDARKSETLERNYSANTDSFDREVQNFIARFPTVSEPSICTEQNNTDIGQTNIIQISVIAQNDTGDDEEDDDHKKDDNNHNYTRSLESDAKENERHDAVCIQQNDSNVGLPYSIAVPPTLQDDDSHSESNGNVQVDYSENSDTMRNGADNDVYDKNNNNTDILHLLKIPGYITSKICISLEDLEQKFHMNLEDAAKSFHVSRSSLKRICRNHGIKRWPCRKRRKISQQERSNPKDANKHVQKYNDEKKQYTMTHAKIISPLGSASKANNDVVVKARYGDDVIKFRLSVLSVDGLRENISKRLELEMRSYRLKYKDDAGDLILITCDDDLHDFLGCNSIDIIVSPVANYRSASLYVA